jgi:hypothetical protein
VGKRNWGGGSIMEDSLENRLGLVDEICKFHPHYGESRGWSNYTGGFVDSGGWHVRKMLDVPVRELRIFLDWMISEDEGKRTEDVKHVSLWEYAEKRNVDFIKKIWDGK